MESIFGVGLPELILILVIAGLVMGPERIGRVSRWLGRTTGQLQAISRGFVQQLQNEIDGIDDGEALKGALNEVQALRRELESLRSEFTTVTGKASQEGKEAFEAIENSIKPPSLMPKLQDTRAKDETDTAVAANGSTTAGPAATPTDLPNLVDVPDDPE